MAFLIQKDDQGDNNNHNLFSILQDVSYLQVYYLMRASQCNEKLVKQVFFLYFIDDKSGFTEAMT